MIDELFPKTRECLRQEALHEDPADWGGSFAAAWDELDRAEAALRAWSECYPEDVFVPITDEQLKAVVALLRENGYTSDALYAHWGRHIVASLRREMGQ